MGPYDDEILTLSVERTTWDTDRESPALSTSENKRRKAPCAANSSIWFPVLFETAMNGIFSGIEPLFAAFMSSTRMDLKMEYSHLPQSVRNWIGC